MHGFSPSTLAGASAVALLGTAEAADLYSGGND
jgi:hypothetical protein